ncbi:hypothetical protein SCOCK_750016 [Actinacidiphila cocklensis]|uniref:Uncharacterized protein n=1 Tax=Actinacidiphila cocklensis TaxID=887465 RepID=A0A9W4EBL9_9ACTN|nr:hypothetical protein SCOCK_750016 [Actinacidiphila cocklensis]
MPPSFRHPGLAYGIGAPYGVSGVSPGRLRPARATA